MGVMSGLIAHNRDDLEELRRAAIVTTNSPCRKQDSSALASPDGLNKATRKVRYTVTVFADDASIEKKDKTAGRPVQFTCRGATEWLPTK